MIRTGWFVVVMVFATLVLGPVILVAAVLRIRGSIYDRVPRLWCRILFAASGSRLRVHGREEVDWTRPQVVVCNHTGAFEILALAISIPVPFHFIVKKELEKVPIFGLAWRAAGHISIDRENREKAIESLQHASRIIHADGGVIVIFPEGTRSRTGQLQPFKKGAFMLAIEAQVPILPTVATGSDLIFRSDRMRITPGLLDLYYGDAVKVEGISPENVDWLIGTVRGRMEAMLRNANALAET